MRKIFVLAFKDVRITYLDVTAILLILVAPLAMTLVMSFAFSDNDSGFAKIPVGLINSNSETGMMGELTQGIFESDAITEYLEIESYNELDQALTALDNDKLAAIIVMPETDLDVLIDFSAQSDPANLPAEKEEIHLYTSVTRPISGMIVEAILDSIVTDLNSGYGAGTMGFINLLESGQVSPEQLSEGFGEEVGVLLEPFFKENQSKINIESHYQESESDDGGFNWLGYMAPSMAILYLGFAMNSSAKSILSERENGTLPRLFCSPTKPHEIILGKMLGTFLIGLIQVLLFILLSSLILNLNWGSLFVVCLFTLTVVLASASWGILIAAISKNSGQASTIGVAVNLVFAAVAGNFYPRINFPPWLENLGYLTPNAWGIEGYLKLISGGALTDVLPGLLSLTGMAIILLIFATITFNRQYGTKKQSEGSHNA